MTPKPITCAADLADGNKCNQSGNITRTQYLYGRLPALGGPSDYTLSEIHYTAVCPRCGERKIIEPH